MDGGDSYDNDGGSPWANSSPGGDEERRPSKVEKRSNVLPLWGNERTMNMNPLILTNIQSSHYFKVNLYELKTYHEVIDEIFYKVTHLEPWEKGSRKTAGQTGMCGGVRGVGAGGIVSTAYCLLYKLFTLKLTRKQVNGLLTHPDSPYIRGLGFMYIRYTQPPADLWDWYDAYLEDPEDMDVKAGGGQVMTIGDMLRAFLTKLEWFSTLFPRIPVPIQQTLQRKMAERFPPTAVPAKPIKPPARLPAPSREARHIPDEELSFGEAERFSRLRRPEGSPSANRGSESRDRKRGHSSEADRDRDRKRGHGDEAERDRERRRGHSSDAKRNEARRDKPRDRSHDRERSSKHPGSRGSKESHSSRDHRRRNDDDDFTEELRREKDRQGKVKHRDNERPRHKHRS